MRDYTWKMYSHQSSLVKMEKCCTTWNGSVPLIGVHDRLYGGGIFLVDYPALRCKNMATLRRRREATKRGGTSIVNLQVHDCESSVKSIRGDAEMFCSVISFTGR